MREIENWLTDKELESINTSSYWNDIEAEMGKDSWIEDGNYEKFLNYLDSSKLLSEYQRSEKFIEEFSGKSIKVVDLAAGIGWTSALLSKLPYVNEVHAVEISKHRLGSLFEHCIKLLKGDSEKIYRHLGSFYDLKFDDKSIDIIYLVQGFHHADKPLKLIYECDRVLKDGGRIILVGEYFIGIKRIIRRFFANLIIRRQFTPNFNDLFWPDLMRGDYYYRQSDYYFMFGSMGYNVKQYLENNRVIYVADKKL
jgi:SAM-dependent methyltransferase